MTVKIKRPWTSLKEQKLESGVNDEYWDIENLVRQAKKLDIMEIPMDHLCIDQNIAGIPIRTFVSHTLSIMDCSHNQYPIILDDTGSIMDGRHRVARALFDKEKSIKAVRFEENPKTVKE